MASIVGIAGAFVSFVSAKTEYIRNRARYGSNGSIEQIILINVLIKKGMAETTGKTCGLGALETAEVAQSLFETTHSPGDRSQRAL